MSDIKELTNNFIKFLYKDDDKAPNYLSKKGSELRGYISAGATTKPLHKKYDDWLAGAAPALTPTAVVPTPTAVVPTAPTLASHDSRVAELEAQVAHFKRKSSNLQKKLTASHEELTATQESKAQVEENLVIFKADYKEKCEEFNRQALLLESKGMSKDHIEQHHVFRAAFYACSCRADEK